MSSIMITPTDQQITEAFSKYKGDDFSEGETLTAFRVITNNSEFKTAVQSSLKYVATFGKTGVAVAMSLGVFAGIELGKKLAQQESANLGAGTGALQGAGSSRGI